MLTNDDRDVSGDDLLEIEIRGFFGCSLRELERKASPGTKPTEPWRSRITYYAICLGEVSAQVNAEKEHRHRLRSFIKLKLEV